MRKASINLIFATVIASAVVGGAPDAAASAKPARTKPVSVSKRKGLGNPSGRVDQFNRAHGIATPKKKEKKR